MKRKTAMLTHSALVVALVSTYSIADNDPEEVSAPYRETAAGSVCEGYGPQTPRDIDNRAGENPRRFSLAPAHEKMNLCDMHFHHNAEHKAADFSIYAGEGDDGLGGGYQCKMSQSLTEDELKAPEEAVCKGLKPGDTIEVHWVYSSCDVEPDHSLVSCLSDACANPDLRVETQVFTLVNDHAALDFNAFSYADTMTSGYHQAKSLPGNTGDPVEFEGSTTGPKYTEQQCSPLQVTWRVRPQCAKLDINTLGQWCKGNIFNEDHAHGVRKLVTDVRLLSEIE